jgi:hypothetical protein
MFGNFVPGFADLDDKSRNNDPYLRRDLNRAYVHASILSFGLAGIVAVLAESMFPLLAAGVASGVMIAGYESALPPAQRLAIFQPPFLADPAVIDGSFRRLD